MKYVICNERLKEFYTENEKQFKPTHEGDAGIDMRACISSLKEIVIFPGRSLYIPSGIVCAVPAGFVGLLIPRSGLSINHGITLSNIIGCIDSGYRGEIVMAIHNNHEEPYTIKKFDRIAQLVVVPHYDYAQLTEVNSLEDTERNDAGFGSTGTG